MGCRISGYRACSRFLEAPARERPITTAWYLGDSHRAPLSWPTRRLQQAPENADLLELRGMARVAAEVTDDFGPRRGFGEFAAAVRCDPSNPDRYITRGDVDRRVSLPRSGQQVASDRSLNRRFFRSRSLTTVGACLSTAGRCLSSKAGFQVRRGRLDARVGTLAQTDKATSACRVLLSRSIAKATSCTMPGRAMIFLRHNA